MVRRVLIHYLKDRRLPLILNLREPLTTRLLPMRDFPFKQIGMGPTLHPFLHLYSISWSRQTPPPLQIQRFLLLWLNSKFLDRSRSPQHTCTLEATTKSSHQVISYVLLSSKLHKGPSSQSLGISRSNFPQLFIVEQLDRDFLASLPQPGQFISQVFNLLPIQNLFPQKNRNELIRAAGTRIHRLLQAL